MRAANRSGSAPSASQPLGVSHLLFHVLDFTFTAVALSDTAQAVIEVDGPSEFSTNQRLPLGTTVARKCMLEALGYNVRSIPWFQWAALQSPEMQRAYLLQLLRTISLQQSQSPEQRV